MVFNLDMARLLDNLQMTFINRSVVISRAVTILRSNETYLCIEGLRKAFAGSKGSRRDQGATGFTETKHRFRVGSAHCPGRLRCDVFGGPLFAKVPCGGGEEVQEGSWDAARSWTWGVRALMRSAVQWDLRQRRMGADVVEGSTAGEQRIQLTLYLVAGRGQSLSRFLRGFEDFSLSVFLSGFEVDLFYVQCSGSLFGGMRVRLEQSWRQVLSSKFQVQSSHRLLVRCRLVQGAGR